MKVRLYAGDMNLNRKIGKNVEIKKFEYFRKENGETFFLVQMFYSPMGYLAIIMFWMSANISMVYRGTLIHVHPVWFSALAI